jgi:ATP-dependent RNA helicase DDX56/DBP9
MEEVESSPIEEEEKAEEVIEETVENGDEEEDEITEFTDMGIDDRILMAILQLGWTEPTPIQETAIPLILEGRDILAKARTGSGKTGAYAIPLLHKILSIKKLKSSKQSTNALILTPSRELCSQACKNLQELTVYCQREITFVDLSSSQMTIQAQKQLLSTKPDVIISTPTKILNHLKDQTSSIDLKSSLELIVIDEADLLLSFGYEEEMKSLIK